MSRENVELVKTLQPAEADLVELFAIDPPANADLYSPDISRFADDFDVAFVSDIPGNDRLSYRGLEGFAEGWRDWLEPWANYWMTAEEFIDAGDKVVVLIRVTATTARDGVVVEHEPAAVWTVADGQVVSLGLYLSREDAFHEAGISDQTKPVQEPRR